jgi:hypothetical protein
VYGASDQLLARAGLARDQNSRLHARYSLYHLIDGLHTVGAANDVAEASALALGTTEGAILFNEV